MFRGAEDSLFGQRGCNIARDGHLRAAGNQFCDEHIYTVGQTGPGFARAAKFRSVPEWLVRITMDVYMRLLPAGFLIGLMAATMPGFAQAPLPEPGQLVRDVEAHQRQMDQIRETFTFHEIEEKDEIDGKGNVTKRESEEREVFFANRHRIVRVVKKNGKELSAGDQKDEQDRVRKAVEKAVKTPLSSNSFREGGVIELSRLLPVMSILLTSVTLPV